MVKHSKLIRLIAVLGVVFLYIFGVRQAKEYGLIIAYSTFDNILLLVPVIVGTLFLTVGICRIGIEHLKLSKNKKSKAAYAILVLLVAFLGSWTLYFIIDSSLPSVAY